MLTTTGHRRDGCSDDDVDGWLSTHQTAAPRRGATRAQTRVLRSADIVRISTSLTGAGCRGERAPAPSGDGATRLGRAATRDGDVRRELVRQRQAANDATFGARPLHAGLSTCDSRDHPHRLPRPHHGTPAPALPANTPATRRSN